MKLTDRVYGDIEIKDKVIIDLINSTAFQRLKGISQSGATIYIEPHRDVTRYEHSIGVWYLSKKYNRPIEEQIACLLHDVPHTAFSHVIDVVMEDPDHEYHDRLKDKIILNSDIPEILEKNNIDINKVLDVEKFPLLENNLPDISVDRWDYFLRDGLAALLIPKDTTNLFMSSLKEEGERFYFEDINTASMATILFMNFSRLLWLDPTSHGSYFILAEVLKIGLKKKIITEDDFFLTDSTLMDKLRQSKDKEMIKKLDELNPKLNFIYTSKEASEFFGANKPRAIDPLVKHEGKLVRTSDLIPVFKYWFEEFKERYSEIGVRRSA
jgi:hypothetical protein